MPIIACATASNQSGNDIASALAVRCSTVPSTISSGTAARTNITGIVSILTGSEFDGDSGTIATIARNGGNSITVRGNGIHCAPGTNFGNASDFACAIADNNMARATAIGIAVTGVTPITRSSFA